MIVLIILFVQIICVRDNIVVRAGGDEVGEKPYIAKISSIWRESAGKFTGLLQNMINGCMQSLI